jgi:hypothetical protein
LNTTPTSQEKANKMTKRRPQRNCHKCLWANNKQHLVATKEKKTLEEQIACISAEAKRLATRAVQLSQLSHPKTSRKQPPRRKK